MKYSIFTIGLLLINLCSNGQNVDSLGMNTRPELNNSEVVYFNTQVNKPDSFDFKNKRLGFFYYNNGSHYISKKEYFERWGKEYFRNNDNVSNQLLFLTSSEKVQSGGYDVIIVAWSKMDINEKDKPRLIRRLKRKGHNKN